MFQQALRWLWEPLHPGCGGWWLCGSCHVVAGGIPRVIIIRRKPSHPKVLSFPGVSIHWLLTVGNKGLATLPQSKTSLKGIPASGFLWDLLRPFLQLLWGSSSPALFYFPHSPTDTDPRILSNKLPAHFCLRVCFSGSWTQRNYEPGGHIRIIIQGPDLLLAYPYGQKSWW